MIGTITNNKDKTKHKKRIIQQTYDDQEKLVLQQTGKA